MELCLKIENTNYNFNNSFNFEKFKLVSCTYTLFGKIAIKQKSYFCIVCDPIRNKKLCKECLITCHKSCLNFILYNNYKISDNKIFLNFNIDKYVSNVKYNTLNCKLPNNEEQILNSFICNCGENKHIISLKTTNLIEKNNNCYLKYIDYSLRDIYKYSCNNCFSKNICKTCYFKCHFNCMLRTKKISLNKYSINYSCDCAMSYHNNLLLYYQLLDGITNQLLDNTDNTKINWPIKIFNSLFDSKKIYDNLLYPLNKVYNYKNILKLCTNTEDTNNSFQQLIIVLVKNINNLKCLYYFHPSVNKILSLYKLYNLLRDAFNNFDSINNLIYLNSLISIIYYIHIKNDFSKIKYYCIKDFLVTNIKQRFEYKLMYKSTDNLSNYFNKIYYKYIYNKTLLFSLLLLCLDILSKNFEINLYNCNNIKDIIINLKLFLICLKIMIFDSIEIITLINKINCISIKLNKLIKLKINYEYLESQSNTYLKKNLAYNIFSIVNKLLKIMFLLAINYNDSLILDYIFKNYKIKHSYKSNNTLLNNKIEYSFTKNFNNTNSNNNLNKYFFKSLFIHNSKNGNELLYSYNISVAYYSNIFFKYLNFEDLDKIEYTDFLKLQLIFISLFCKVDNYYFNQIDSIEYYFNHPIIYSNNEDSYLLCPKSIDIKLESIDIIEQKYKDNNFSDNANNKYGNTFTNIKFMEMDNNFFNEHFKLYELNFNSHICDNIKDAFSFKQIIYLDNNNNESNIIDIGNFNSKNCDESSIINDKSNINLKTSKFLVKNNYHNEVLINSFKSEIKNKENILSDEEILNITNKYTLTQLIHIIIFNLKSNIESKLSLFFNNKLNQTELYINIQKYINKFNNDIKIIITKIENNLNIKISKHLKYNNSFYLEENIYKNELYDFTIVLNPLLNNYNKFLNIVFNVNNEFCNNNTLQINLVNIINKELLLSNLDVTLSNILAIISLKSDLECSLVKNIVCLLNIYLYSKDTIIWFLTGKTTKYICMLFKLYKKLCIEFYYNIFKGIFVYNLNINDHSNLLLMFFNIADYIIYKKYIDELTKEEYSKYFYYLISIINYAKLLLKNIDKNAIVSKIIMHILKNDIIDVYFLDKCFNLVKKDNLKRYISDSCYNNFKDQNQVFKYLNKLFLKKNHKTSKSHNLQKHKNILKSCKNIKSIYINKFNTSYNIYNIEEKNEKLNDKTYNFKDVSSKNYNNSNKQLKLKYFSKENLLNLFNLNIYKNIFIRHKKKLFLSKLNCTFKNNKETIDNSHTNIKILRIPNFTFKKIYFYHVNFIENIKNRILNNISKNYSLLNNNLLNKKQNYVLNTEKLINNIIVFNKRNKHMSKYCLKFINKIFNIYYNHSKCFNYLKYEDNKTTIVNKKSYEVDNYNNNIIDSNNFKTTNDNCDNINSSRSLINNKIKSNFNNDNKFYYKKTISSEINENFEKNIINNIKEDLDYIDICHNNINTEYNNNYKKFLNSCYLNKYIDSIYNLNINNSQNININLDKSNSYYYRRLFFTVVELISNTYYLNKIDDESIVYIEKIINIQLLIKILNNIDIILSDRIKILNFCRIYYFRKIYTQNYKYTINKYTNNNEISSKLSIELNSNNEIDKNELNIDLYCKILDKKVDKLSNETSLSSNSYIKNAAHYSCKNIDNEYNINKLSPIKKTKSIQSDKSLPDSLKSNNTKNISNILNDDKISNILKLKNYFLKEYLTIVELVRLEIKYSITTIWIYQHQSHNVKAYIKEILLLVKCCIENLLSQKCFTNIIYTKLFYLLLTLNKYCIDLTNIYNNIDDDYFMENIKLLYFKKNSCLINSMVFEKIYSKDFIYKNFNLIYEYFLTSTDLRSNLDFANILVNYNHYFTKNLKIIKNDTLLLKEKYPCINYHIINSKQNLFNPYSNSLYENEGKKLVNNIKFSYAKNFNNYSSLSICNFLNNSNIRNEIYFTIIFYLKNSNINKDIYTIYSIDILTNILYIHSNVNLINTKDLLNDNKWFNSFISSTFIYTIKEFDTIFCINNTKRIVDLIVNINLVYLMFKQLLHRYCLLENAENLEYLNIDLLITNPEKDNDLTLLENFSYEDINTNFKCQDIKRYNNTNFLSKYLNNINFNLLVRKDSETKSLTRNYISNTNLSKRININSDNKHNANVLALNKNNNKSFCYSQNNSDNNIYNKNLLKTLKEVVNYNNNNNLSNKNIEDYNLNSKFICINLSNKLIFNSIINSCLIKEQNVVSNNYYDIINIKPDSCLSNIEKIFLLALNTIKYSLDNIHFEEFVNKNNSWNKYLFIFDIAMSLIIEFVRCDIQSLNKYFVYTKPYILLFINILNKKFLLKIIDNNLDNYILDNKLKNSLAFKYEGIYLNIIHLILKFINNLLLYNNKDIFKFISDHLDIKDIFQNLFLVIDLKTNLLYKNNYIKFKIINKIKHIDEFVNFYLYNEDLIKKSLIFNIAKEYFIYIKRSIDIFRDFKTNSLYEYIINYTNIHLKTKPSENANIFFKLNRLLTKIKNYKLLNFIMKSISIKNIDNKKFEKSAIINKQNKFKIILMNKLICNVELINPCYENKTTNKIKNKDELHNIIKNNNKNCTYEYSKKSSLNYYKANNIDDIKEKNILTINSQKNLFINYYFIKPSICFYLSKNSIKEYFESCKGKVFLLKLALFNLKLDYFLFESMYNKNFLLNKNKLIKKMHLEFNYFYLEIINFFIILVNQFMLYYYSQSDLKTNFKYGVNTYNYIITILQISYCLFCIYIYSFFKLKLLYYKYILSNKSKFYKHILYNSYNILIDLDNLEKEEFSKNNYNNTIKKLKVGLNYWKSIYNLIITGLILNSEINLLLFTIIFNLGFLLLNNITLLTIEVLFLASFSKLLHGLLKVFLSKINYLISSIVLAILIIFVFSFYGFLYMNYSFPTDESVKIIDNNALNNNILDNQCLNIYFCSTYWINNGLRYNESLSKISYINSPSMYIERFFYDIFFYLIIPSAFANIFLAIILDAFAEIRDKITKDIKYTEKTCFFCNLNEKTALIKNINFLEHKKNKHNIMQYFNYIVFIILLDKKEYGKIESICNKKLRNNDYSWMSIKYK